MEYYISILVCTKLIIYPDLCKYGKKSYLFLDMAKPKEDTPLLKLPSVTPARVEGRREHGLMQERSRIRHF